MNNSTSSYRDTGGHAPNEDILEQEQPGGIVNGWYRLTSPPEPPAGASFVKRESARRARLVSAVGFFLLAMLVVLLPAAFYITILILYVVLGMLALSCLALALNRAGNTLWAGILIVVAGEVGVIGAIVVLTPLDLIHLPAFDFLILGELMAVSLLPARSVIFVALFNIAYILVYLWVDPQKQLLAADFQKALESPLFIVALLRPIALEIVVAGVAYLWVRSTTNAIARADRAEMIATLEHQLAAQKSDLESGIQQILNTHSLIAKGDLTARVPLNKDQLLWQVANSLNTFLARYQRACFAEQKLQYIANVIPSLSGMLQEAIRKQTYVQLPLTKTELDPLLQSFNGVILALNQFPFPQSPTSDAPAEKNPFPTPDSFPHRNWQ